MPSSSAEYRGDRKQLDALLSLLSELQDRQQNLQQTTINVAAVQSDSDIQLQFPASANLPDYLKQLAKEAGININNINTDADAIATIPDNNSNSNPGDRLSISPERNPQAKDLDIEDVEDLDAIADSVSYLQELLFGPTPPELPGLLELTELAELENLINQSQYSDLSHQSDLSDLFASTRSFDEVRPEHTPQENSSESREALTLLQNILVQPEVTTLRHSLEQLEQKVVSLEHQVNDPTELDNLDQKLAQLKNQFGDKSEMQNVHSEIANLAKQQINLPTELASLKHQLADLGRKLVTLQDQVNDPTEIANLDSKLANIQNQVQDKSEIKNVQTELANLARQQTNIPTQLASLKRQLADLGIKVEAAQSQIQESRADLDLVRTIRPQVESLEAQLADLAEQQHRFTPELTLLLQKVAKVEHLIGDRQELIDLLLPLLNDLISREVGLAGDDLAQALAPIIDRIVDRNVKADKAPMSKALAPVLPDAIRQQAIDAPGDFASAIAPELGNAIRDQVRDNADVMVDALYPIIGSTISKYIAEAIRNINERVENTLSVEGVSRKVRAKLQGVSEAELIFKEAIGFKVQAVFLIHKGSGLIIAEAQPANSQELESEMIAGMLTAIRNFANDCISTGGSASELDEIDYGSFKILLEVAGFCYLAIVVEGEPPHQFIRKVRDTLGKLVQEYHQPIEQFEGDPDTIPEQVPQITGELVESHVQQKTTKPKGLVILAAIVLGLVIVPWGIWQYRQNIERRIATNASTALLATPELSIYRLEVEANQDRVTLHGRVPNQYLRNLAEQVTKTAVSELPSDLAIDNQIIAVRIPSDPSQTASEVERTIATFNNLEGIKISANLANGKVTVAGSAFTSADAQRISQSLAQIPGVDAVVTTIDTTPPAIKTKIFFPSESAQITVKEAQKLKLVKEFIKSHPKYELKIIGGSDRTGVTESNHGLALDRAKAVKAALIAQGVEPRRLQAASRSELSITEGEPEWTGRRVEFEVVKPKG